MPRVGRVVLPNYPHHIVQRGHNRQVVFAVDSDFEYYLETLSQWREVYGIRVYAWCLMTNLFIWLLNHLKKWPCWDNS